jgi:hypothetical protein
VKRLLHEHASRIWILLACVAVLASAAGVQAAVEAATEQRSDPAVEETGRKPLRPLNVSGHVRGLYPGSSRRLRVRVGNPTRRDLLVRSVRAHVGDAGPGCGSRNVVIARRRVRLRLAKHEAVRVRLRARMRSAAGDACQGARFPLRLHARARVAR